jgi:hypothetical protein
MKSIAKAMRAQQQVAEITARTKRMEEDPIYILMNKASNLRYNKLNGKYSEKHFSLFTIFAPEKVLKHIDTLFEAKIPLNNFLGIPTFAGLDDKITLYYNDDFIGTIMISDELPLS